MKSTSSASSFLFQPLLCAPQSSASSFFPLYCVLKNIILLPLTICPIQFYFLYLIVLRLSYSYFLIVHSINLFYSLNSSTYPYLKILNPQSPCFAVIYSITITRSASPIYSAFSDLHCWKIASFLVVRHPRQVIIFVLTKYIWCPASYINSLTDKT